MQFSLHALKSKEFEVTLHCVMFLVSNLINLTIKRATVFSLKITMCCKPFTEKMLRKLAAKKLIDFI